MSGSGADRSARHALRRALEDQSETLVEALSAAVRIPSVVPTFPGGEDRGHLGREGDVSRLVADLLADAGCEIDLFAVEPGRENCVAVLPGSGSGRSLAFNGHVDVVPPQPDAQWKHGGPWSGAVEDGCVWGRGACDMKGGLIAAVFALRAIAATGAELRGDLMLHAVVGEEMMDHELGTTAVLERGYATDAAVVAEPAPHGTPLAVCPATEGIFWFTLSIRGKGAHAGMRAESLREGGEAVGVNAADLAMRMQLALSELERTWLSERTHPLFRPGSFTIHPGVVIAAPDAAPMPFGLAEHAVLEYIVWYPPGESADPIREEIERCISSVAADIPWLIEHPPEVEWRHHWPPASIPVEHDLVVAVSDAHRRAHGSLPVVEGLPAVADSYYYVQVGVPALTYGPGDIALAHAADERVRVDEVVAASLTLAELAADWCGT